MRDITVRIDHLTCLYDKRCIQQLNTVTHVGGVERAVCCLSYKLEKTLVELPQVPSYHKRNNNKRLFQTSRKSEVEDTFSK